MPTVGKLSFPRYEIMSQKYKAQLNIFNQLATTCNSHYWILREIFLAIVCSPKVYRIYCILCKLCVVLTDLLHTSSLHKEHQTEHLSLQEKIWSTETLMSNLWPNKNKQANQKKKSLFPVHLESWQEWKK